MYDSMYVADDNLEITQFVRCSNHNQKLMVHQEYYVTVYINYVTLCNIIYKYITPHVSCVLNLYFTEATWTQFWFQFFDGIF